MNTDIKTTQRHTIQYWYIDGIPELALGGFFLLLGGYLFVINAMPDTLLAGLLGGFFVLVFFGGLYLSGRVVRSLKEHITYPRTGYVAYRQDKKGRRPLRIFLTSLVSALVAGLVVFATTIPMLGLDIVPAISGFFVAVGLMFLGRRVGLGRFYAIAIFNLLLGGALTLARANTNFSLAIFYGVDGMVLLAVGAFVLSRYLSNHPTPAQDGDEQ